MDQTPVSLLERLRRPADPAAWERFVDLVTPLLYRWARRAGLQESDAADLVQDVLVVLVEKLPEFRYDPRHSFRAWLHTVALNRWRNRRRRPEPDGLGDGGRAELVSPDAGAAFAEAEYRRHLLGRALRLVRGDFQPGTWQAFWEHVVRDRPAAEVAAELGLRVDSVYAAKSRVLRRLRQELDGLLD
jgi:RNA polymerase sigma-70 factor (ECF subfamily)